MESIQAVGLSAAVTPRITGSLKVLEPELNLWRAVLVQAIKDALRKNRAPDRRLSDSEKSQLNRRLAEANDAQKWFFRESEDDFSFLWVCDALLLSPDAIRAEMRQKILLLEGGGEYDSSATP